MNEKLKQVLDAHAEESGEILGYALVTFHAEGFLMAVDVAQDDEEAMEMVDNMVAAVGGEDIPKAVLQ